jgi:hypothetical protein
VTTAHPVRLDASGALAIRGEDRSTTRGDGMRLVATTYGFGEALLTVLEAAA